MKYIKSFANDAAYEADKPNFEAPHVGYIEDTDEVKYINDMTDLYDIYGSVTDGTSSMTIKINNANQNATVSNGKFGLIWTGGTITSLKECFSGKPVNKIEKLELDTSSVTDMSLMFGGLRNITSVDVSNFDTSSVTTMNSMFTQCSGLTSIDVSNFNTSGVTNMTNMFSMTGLITLDLSNFDTSSVTAMTGMIGACTALETLNISNFNAENATGHPLYYNIFSAQNSPRSLTSIIMDNTSQTTFDLITSKIPSDVRANITITRNGTNYIYQNDEWVAQ